MGRNSQNNTRTNVTLTSRPQPSSWLALIVLGPVMMGITDGCLRKTSEGQRTMATTPSIAAEITTTSMPDMLGLPCTEAEVGQAKCLHGGTCFALVIGDQRKIQCHCTAEFDGTRCQHPFIDPDIWAVSDAHMRTASIAAGLSGCILVIFAILLGVYVYQRRKKTSTSSNNVEDPASREKLQDFTGQDKEENFCKGGDRVLSADQQKLPIIETNGFSKDTKIVTPLNSSVCKEKLRQGGGQDLAIDVEAAEENGGSGYSVKVHESCQHETQDFL